MTTTNPFQFEHNEDRNEWCISIIHEFGFAGEQAVFGVGSTIDEAMEDLKQECEDTSVPFPAP